MDWKIKLYTEEKITSTVQYIGIRAHDLEMGQKDGCNTYQMEMVSCMEAPFEQIFYIRPYGYRSDTEHVKIWWKQEKNLNWEDESRQFPCFKKKILKKTPLFTRNRGVFLMNSRISDKVFQDQVPSETIPENCDGKVSDTV